MKTWTDIEKRRIQAAVAAATGGAVKDCRPECFYGAQVGRLAAMYGREEREGALFQYVDFTPSIIFGHQELCPLARFRLN